MISEAHKYLDYETSLALLHQAACFHVKEVVVHVKGKKPI